MVGILVAEGAIPVDFLADNRRVSVLGFQVLRTVLQYAMPWYAAHCAAHIQPLMVPNVPLHPSVFD